MSPRVRVLLLDDSPAERELVLTALGEFGGDLDLRATGSPQEAELLMETFAPELVLIDLHLGRWSGRELLTRLRGRVGAVILTTTDDPQEAARCLAAGALGFWVKPMRFDGFAELFRRVRELAASA